MRARARVRVTVAFLIFRDAPFLELAQLRVSTGLASLLGHLSLAIRLGHRHIRRDGCESSALGARLVGGELGAKRRNLGVLLLDESLRCLEILRQRVLVLEQRSDRPIRLHDLSSARETVSV